jgi:RNA recognition motif 2
VASHTSYSASAINQNAPDFQPSSSFASSTNTEERLSNEVDIYKILKGEEARTTIMVRNIPNKFKQMTLLEMINKRNSNKYDYFYLPMDLKVTPQIIVLILCL